MTRLAIAASIVAIALLGAGCTSKPAPPKQVAAATPFAPNPNATPDVSRRAVPAELRSPAGIGAPIPVPSPAPQRPRRSGTTGPCADPEIVLSTIIEERPQATAWTFLVTANCALSRMELNIRLATAGAWDAQCFTVEYMRRQRTTPPDEWTDMACSQVGYPPNNDLIEGWWFEGAFVPEGASESSVTILHRLPPGAPPGLPAPVGLLLTWNWDGGRVTKMAWDALPLIGRSVEPKGETITRGLPLPPGP